MKQNIFTKILLTCLIICCFLLPVHGYGTGDNTVNVGYISGYGVIDDINSIDSKGYGYDILKAAEQYSSLQFKYTEITEDNILSSLNSGAIELFGPLSYTDARATAYEFSRSFGVQQIMLLAPTTSSIRFDDTTAFNGKAVTSISGMGFDSYLTTYAAQKGISMSLNNVTTFNEYYASNTELHLASSLMSVQNKNVVANLGLEQLYFVAKKGNTSLVSAVNSALNTLEINNPLFMSETHSYYFNTASASPTISVAQSNLLLSKNTFTVGYLSNHYPVEALGDDGRPEGIAIDLLELVAKEAGIKLQYSPYTIDSNPNHNNFDLNIAWSSLEDFNLYYNSSTAFSKSTRLMLLAKEGISDPYTQVKRIGIMPSVVFDSSTLNSNYPTSTFTTYHTYADIVKALDKGEIDGALLSSVTCDYVSSQLGDDYTHYNTPYSYPIRLFINKNLGDDYLNLFNTLINRLDETEVEKAFLSQVSKYRAEPTLFEIITGYWYIYLTGILLVTGSFLGLYMMLQRKKQQAVLDALNVDEITGLYSEIKFISEVESIMKTAEEDEYMIVTFDIDHFSLIRKQYGYDKSNDVLTKIGETLEESYPEDCIVARSKADLFLIFSKQNAPGRAICGKHICDECVIDCAKDLLASTHPLSVSEGVYRISDTEMPVQLMIDYSNMARLQGKSVYGLTVNEYTKELDAKRELNNSIVLRMERALLGKELIPYYQPKVHLKSSMVTGAEALVRWCDIDSDLEVPQVKYMPDEFIPLFEENGFIAKLDYHIFDEICSFIRRNMKTSEVPKISINLSGVTLLKNDLRGTLVDALERYRVLPKDIDLEITESAFTQYPKESASKVRMLRKEGFTISMDDFGTGASSLNRLKDMDITTIKLDKAFLDYNLAELKGSVIIGNMINMARRLGLEVVAEGVETKEQLSALKMLHCDLVQGYYFAKPVNETDFLKMLEEPVCLSAAERAKKQKAADMKAKKGEDRGELIP